MFASFLLSTRRATEMKLRTFVRDVFSHIHDLSRTRVESRSIHVFSRDKHLGSQIIFIHFRWYSYRERIPIHRNINLAIFPSLPLLQCSSSTNSSVRARIYVFTRKYLTLPCSRASDSSPAFGSIFFLFSFPFHLSARKRAGPIFPNLFLSRTRAGNVRRARIRWWVSLDGATRILSFDPHGQNCNIAREEETHRFVIFRAYFWEKKNNWYGNIDCGFETISISREPLLDKQDISDLREREHI